MNSYALTTVARLQAFSGIVGNDDVLEVIIDAVTDFVEKECNRRFKETAYVGEKLDGEGTKQILLSQYPISSSATLKLYERESFDYGDDNWDEINSNDYRVDYDSGIINSNSKFLSGFQNYKADYTAGYAFNNVGDSLITLASVGLSDLEMAVWKLCVRAFNERKGGGNIQRMKLYNYDVTFSKEAYNDDEIREILSKYKRLEF